MILYGQLKTPTRKFENNYALFVLKTVRTIHINQSVWPPGIFQFTYIKTFKIFLSETTGLF